MGAELFVGLHSFTSGDCSCTDKSGKLARVCFECYFAYCLLSMRTFTMSIV